MGTVRLVRSAYFWVALLMAVGIGGPVLCALTRIVHIPMAFAIRPVVLVLWMVCVVGVVGSIFRQRLQNRWHQVWLTPAILVLLLGMDALLIGCASGFHAIIDHFGRDDIFMTCFPAITIGLTSAFVPRQADMEGPRQYFRCVRCGYDIRESVDFGRCPECGHLFEVGKDIPYLPKHLRAMEELEGEKLSDNATREV